MLKEEETILDASKAHLKSSLEFKLISGLPFIILLLAFCYSGWIYATTEISLNNIRLISIFLGLCVLYIFIESMKLYLYK